jgi:hypothetical protein
MMGRMRIERLRNSDAKKQRNGSSTNLTMSHDNPFAEIEKLEADLWKSADDLRANSKQ